MTKHQEKLLAASLEYLSRGWSVIPLTGKRPSLRTWARYQEELPTENNLHTWFRRRGVTGVGIITGIISNLVVLDVDEHVEKFTKYTTYDTPVVKTGSDGFHVYFTPASAANYQTHHLDGYDIQANGALVAAPPSIHPDTKKNYVWLTPQDRKPLLFPKEIADNLLGIDESFNAKKPIIPTKQSISSTNRISESTIKELTTLPIADVIASSGIIVPSTQKHYVNICCPFHNDSNPSFSVHFQKNFAQCFGCGKTVNTIQFIQDYLNLGFREACQYLFEKFGIKNE